LMNWLNRPSRARGTLAGTLVFAEKWLPW